MLSRRTTLLTGLATGAAALPWPARGQSQRLRVLAWPGYAEPEVVKGFEQSTGATVDLTVIDNDESLRRHLQRDGSASVDVVALNTAELQRAARAGLVQAVDLKRLPNASRQLPRFQKHAAIPGLLLPRDGKTELMGLPFTFADMGLIYDRRQLPSPPDSINALWEPRWRGKVLAYNGASHNFSLAALSLGLQTPFRLAPADWPRAVERLIELRRNVLGFYGQPDESVRLFLRHGAALMFANYGTQQLRLVKEAGVDAGYAIPREGALAWLDCWAITRRASAPDLAHAWIDHLLGTQASRLLVERQGLANTTEEAGGSPASAKLYWLEPEEDVARRETLWARIRSGDRAAKVLAT